MNTIQSIKVIPLNDSAWTVTDVILETLNDYLIEVWSDSKMKKKVKAGMELLGDAINYAVKNLPDADSELIKATAFYLAKENKLIGVSPDHI